MKLFISMELIKLIVKKQNIKKVLIFWNMLLKKIIN